MIQLTNSKDIVQNLEPLRSKSGYSLTRVHESEKGFIYEEVFNASGKIHGYEVFKRITFGAFSIAGKSFPAGTRYPGNEDFGKWAWSVHSSSRD
ncbi:MAG: hypothetical protein IPP86_00245 [Bacteroidetes bacterium]|nr:hypothetical protein [Bacteroidota bacterium]